MYPPNNSGALGQLHATITEMHRGLDGGFGSPITPDAKIDNDQTVRQALADLCERLDRFINGDSKGQNQFERFSDILAAEGQTLRSHPKWSCGCTMSIITPEEGSHRAIKMRTSYRLEPCGGKHEKVWGELSSAATR